MDTFIWTPSYTSKGSRKPRVNQAQFKDYMQTAPDGINPNPLTFALTFNSLDDATILAIDTFLDAHIGVSFLWTAPSPHNAAPLIWQNDTQNGAPDWTLDAFGRKTMTLTLNQMFQP